MKRGRRSKYVVLLISLVLIFSLTGCKASKKKVLESSYYKELQKENKKLKKQNKSLKSKVDAENDMTEDEQRASDYLEKISREHLDKLEVGYADNMDGSEFIEEEAVFSLATIIASRADKTTKWDVSVFSSDLFDECVFLQRGALHLELVDFPAEPGGNPAGGDGGRSPDIDFSFLHGADDHDRADGNHTWVGGAAFTAFEGRCSDGRNCDDSGGCNAVYSGAGRGSGDNPDGADCTRGSV